MRTHFRSQPKTSSLNSFVASANNMTLGASNGDFNLAQNGPGSAFFFLTETGTVGGSQIGGAALELVGSNPVLSVSANSLIVSNISGLAGLSLNLTSAGDINGGSSPTSASITGATSVALQVGVAATLAGDTSSNINYNGSQLIIDDSNLGSFSVTASSINVNSGFPSTPNLALNLTASGVNEDTGGLTVNTGLDAASAIFTADSGNIVLFDSLTAESGNLTLTANNGDVTTHGFLTTNSISTLSITGNNVTTEGQLTSGGDLTLTANNGDISIYNGISVAGNFKATATGNILFSIADPNVGGFMNLSAGGAIELDNDITIASDLTLSAGTFIHSFNNSTVFGATSVTLTLGAPAEISETQGDVSTLFFGVPAASEQEGAGPLAIDLTQVISGSSFVNATATSLTLTSAFDEPNLSLTLAASSGSLTLNGAVTASNFNGSSSGGNLTINGPVTVTGLFSGSAINGNLIINASVTTPSFYGYSSNMITGTGSIFASTVTLNQGGAATVTQPNNNLLSFNTLGVDLNPGDGGATSLTLSANTLTLGGNLSIAGIDLTLSGVINMQGNTITAQNVTLENLNASTGVSGNATNLNINGFSLTFESVGLNGTGSGSGGTLTGVTSSAFDSPGVTKAEISFDANDVMINGDVTSNGGSSSGNGGTVNLTAQDNMNVNDGSVTANGGNATITGAAAGGNGGAVNLTAGLDINVGAPISANGGNASPNGGAAGGNGGTITLDADGNIDVESSITTASGVNGNTRFTGGNGGTVNLTATGEVTINSLIGVSASDLFTNRVSARGGNINVTSHAATGVAINITNSGQLASILNQAAPGPGGAITFLADKGGDVNVSGSLRADHGTIAIQTGTADGSGPGGAVTLNGATLSADVVKVGALGSNGTLNIGNSRISGDTLISLYAAGSSGSIVFSGFSTLSGASLKTIAASIVTIVNGGQVNVSGGAATVYTNTPNYNIPNFGNFTGNGVTTKPLSSKPAF